jgi:ABC-type siderophore export system fused ATPase/permease subunit
MKRRTETGELSELTDRIEAVLETEFVAFRSKARLEPQVHARLRSLLLLSEGRSGSGKSTLAKLLLDLYLPTSGGPLIDPRGTRHR